MKNRILGTLLALTFAGMSAWVCAQNAAPAKPEVRSVRDNKVSLIWGNTEKIYGIFDDFENHRDFAVNSPGELGWSYLDMDNDRTFAIGSYVYENMGANMALGLGALQDHSGLYERKGLAPFGQQVPDLHGGI